ncbi:MAG: hypothetical protein GX275_05150 [Clostridiales bacterium]|nr:hypothetical protein [Clostridiales bacterium]
MIMTVVCPEEGCSGNSFYIETKDNLLTAICKKCGRKQLFDISYYEYMLTSSCSSCKNNTFKLFKDIKGGGVYAKCMECGSPPEQIYIDSDGIQVSYEVKLLHEVKNLMNQVDQRVCNLELKIEYMEKSQEILEESLAYINKYIIEKK